MLDDRLMRAMLGESRSIAIIGAKDKPGQAVDRVGRYLLEQGYRIFPVHPVRKEVWGLPAVPSIAELPEPVDIINLFRAPEYCPGHAQEVLGLDWKPKLFWMQLGIRSPEARAVLADTGITVVEDSCIMVEHARLLRPSLTSQGQGF
jgi:predicted CoA-binding protein